MRTTAFKIKLLLLAGMTVMTACNRPATFTIHMIGDSTMANKDTTGGNPERGWGMVFDDYFQDNVTIMNYARNGRSTQSFLDEKRWDSVKVNISPGDYVFIQFGHNDEKIKNGSRYSAPWGRYQDNLRKFVRESRELGATPVLLTPVARRHFTDGVFQPYSHGDYPAAMKAVAAETRTVSIDMESATIDWIGAAGDMASRPYFMWVEPGAVPAIPDGRQDDTHSTEIGARRNCEIVCDSIRAKIPALAKYLKP